MTGLYTENSLQPGNNNLPPAANFTISNNIVDGANWTATGFPALQLAGIAVDQIEPDRERDVDPDEDDDLQVVGIEMAGKM